MSLPVIFLATFFMTKIAMALYSYGKPHTEVSQNYKLWTTLYNTGVIVLALWWGGFW